MPGLTQKRTAPMFSASPPWMSRIAIVQVRRRRTSAACREGVGRVRATPCQPRSTIARMRTPSQRFAQAPIEAVLRNQLVEALDAAQLIPPDKALATPVHDLVDELTDKFSVNPIELRLERRASGGARDVEITLDDFGGRSSKVPGTRIEVTVPFDGDSELFDVTPSTHTLNPPRFNNRDGCVVVAHEGPSPLDPSHVKNSIDGQIAAIDKYLATQRSDIQPWNEHLRVELVAAVERRREMVLADRALDEFLEVPVVGRADRSTTLAVDPARRPAPKVVTPSQSAPGFAPEPAISDAGYLEILSELESVTTAVQRLPTTFVGMPEESLRDVLLVVLNNRFGPASGETFGRRGKTDIFIAFGGDARAVFIVECKWWKGPKAFRGAIERLLGYVTWRDTKAALMVFVKSGEPSDIEEKASTELRVHELFKRVQTMAGRAVFTFANRDDPRREVHISLLVIPVLP